MKWPLGALLALLCCLRMSQAQAEGSVLYLDQPQLLSRLEDRGYGFDVNRTTVVGGGATLSGDDRRFLEAGHAATEAAVAATRAGATIDSVVQAGRQAVREAGFVELLPASAGHAIGLETVEVPYLGLGNQETLKAGMCLCIEPSIFIPGRIG